MANDSSLLPGTPTPPAAATLTTSSAGTGATANNAIAYDYSPHLIRIVTALEQLSYSMAFIADKLDNLSDKMTVNSDNVTVLVDQVTRLTEQVTRETPRVLEAVATFNGTATVSLASTLTIDPTGYFLQGTDIVAGTYVISYNGINKTLKINQLGYSKIVNGNPIVTTNTATDLPITLVPPIVMTASNISNMTDTSGNLKVISPWEWLGISSITKLYDEKGVNYADLKARVDAIPKSTS
jgi:hypothetical protein